MTGTEPTTPARHDAKDWTAVITDGCAECGFDAGFERRGTGDYLRAAIPRLQGGLQRADVQQRPDPLVWSPLEYAGHILGVGEVFTKRIERMLTEDNPVFDDWDGEKAAVEENYNGQDPSDVGQRFSTIATGAAELYDGITDMRWERPGLRSDGMVFTVATFTAYFRHEIEHHLHDMGV